MQPGSCVEIQEIPLDYCIQSAGRNGSLQYSFIQSMPVGRLELWDGMRRKVSAHLTEGSWVHNVATQPRNSPPRRSSF